MFQNAPLETWLLAFIALCNLTTPVLWWIVREWVKELAVNTNSIKDALVSTTAMISKQAGREEMRIESETKAATLAEGKLSGSKPGRK